MSERQSAQAVFRDKGYLAIRSSFGIIKNVELKNVRKNSENKENARNFKKNGEIKMIYASDFRKGRTFQINGEPHVVLDFLHVKPGKGAAFVRTKYRNIITGATREEAFNPDDKFEEAIIETKKMQYLYNDGEFYNYMDNETFEQIMISAEDAADSMKFVKENEEVTISFYQGNAFAIDPPLSVELVVTETEPGVKGNTATGQFSPVPGIRATPRSQR